MNKREMMVKAHQMAKQMVGNYIARMALALRTLWASIKKGVAKMDKLIIGKDYGFVYGLDKNKGQKIIYNGGVSWTAINGNLKETIECQETTSKMIEELKSWS